jgi:hypothetical protein
MMKLPGTLARQWSSNMDRTRKANREDHERTFQYRSRQETLLGEELVEDQLTQLLAFVAELRQTPAGAAQLQRRVKAFGECLRSEGETSAEFYARLHHWLDRVVPQTKAPLHPPRQTDVGDLE